MHPIDNLQEREVYIVPGQHRNVECLAESSCRQDHMVLVEKMTC